MGWQYSKHYTREEARALLPQIRVWLAKLALNRERLKRHEQQMQGQLTTSDLGGKLVNSWVRLLADVNDLVEEFQNREIEIKDLDRGLIDFPAFIGGKEVFLCWEKDDEDIDYWHDLTSGYGGRERLR